MGSLGSSLHVKTIGRSLPPLSSTHELHSKTCTCSISIRMLNSSASVSLSSHTLRQLKFVIPGALITYYLGTHHVFWDMVNGIGWDGWARYTEFLSIISPFRITPTHRTAAIASFALGCLIVTLFLYVLLVPWIRGIEPNVCTPLPYIPPAKLTEYRRPVIIVPILA